MSRSYKRTPYCGDNKNKKQKRFANKRVRNFLKNFENELSYSNYKKVYESWDICDFGWIISWQEHWNNQLKFYQNHPEWFEKFPDKQEEYCKWYKWYKMK